MADGVTEALEGAYEEMKAWTIDQAHQMARVMGPRPLFSEHVPERVQVKQGSIIYHDPAAWEELLKANGWQGPGSPVPKNVIEYGQRLHRLSQKYPDEMVDLDPGTQRFAEPEDPTPTAPEPIPAPKPQAMQRTVQRDENGRVSGWIDKPVEQA